MERERMNGREYTDEENRFIQDNYKTMTDAEIASRLGRTFRSIRGRRRLLGLRKGNCVPRTWSEKDIKFLKDNYETMTDREIGEVVERSESAVLHCRQRLGLDKKHLTRIPRKPGGKKPLLPKKLDLETKQRAERSARHIAAKLGVPLEKLREITQKMVKE